MFASLNLWLMHNNKSEDFNNDLLQLSIMAKLFSHPARIAIIQLLAEKKEIRTGNISDHLPLSRTTVSQHLKELKKAGIIKGKIDGLKIHYCLDMKRLNEIKNTYTAFFDSTISSFLCDC